MRALREVVVAHDFSSHADRALDVALGLAGPAGARIHLVHAGPAAPGRLEKNLWIPEEVWDRVRVEDASRLDAIRQRVETAGLKVEVHQPVQPASEAIVELARSVDADLIVMGTRGNTGLKHVLLGSVAERTLRRAPCPVVAVPGPDSGDEAD
jgi:nucleotide-binding universal stress UspA family protein